MAALVFKLDRTRGLAATFAALGLFATILSFSLRGANLTGDLSGMTDPIMPVSYTHLTLPTKA